MGGYLLTVTSKGEKYFVEGLRNAQNCADTNLWIGVIRRQYRNVSEWMNGEEWTAPNSYYGFYSIGGDDSYTTVEYGNLSYRSADDGVSLPMYFSLVYRLIGGGPQASLQSSAGENAMKVKHGYICEWGDPINIAEAEVSLSQNDFTYNGQTQRPGTVTVTYRNHVLEEGYDYSLTFTNNVYVGEATVTISGKGRFTGSFTKNYNINPQPVETVSVTAGEPHSLLVAWDASEQADYYEVEYSENRDFSGSVKAPLVKSGTSVTLKNLKRNTRYYVQVWAISLVNGKEFRTIQKYSNIYNTTSSKIDQTDIWGFGNPNYVVGREYYEMLYGPAQAELLYTNNELKNGEENPHGLCYGMTISAISSLYYNTPSVSSLGVSSLYDIKNDRMVLDLIKYAQILQYSKQVDDLKYANAWDLEGLYKAVKNQNVVSIRIARNGVGAHRIWGLWIRYEDEGCVEIEVYDPNKPGESAVLYLYKENGRLKSWYYTMWNGLAFQGGDAVAYINGGDTIGYDSISGQFFADTLKKIEEAENNIHVMQQSILDNSGVLCSVKGNIGNYVKNWKFKEYQPIMIEEGTGSTDTNLYWLSSTDNVDLENVPAGTTITLAAPNHSVSIQVEKTADIVMNVGNTLNNSASVDMAGGGAFTVTYYDAAADSNNSTTTVISGKAEAGKEARISQSEAGVQVTGTTSLSIQEESGAENAQGKRPNPTKKTVMASNLDASASYQASSEEGKIQLKTSSQNNGVFDQVVDTSSASLKVNGTYTSGALKYKVTKLSGSTGTVTVTAPKSKTAASVTIPATVKISGVTLTVNAIGSNAFKGMTKLTKVTIGKNITKIGAGAFSGDKKLAKITVKG
ncbi:MAG: fibronectin type III domain-containing protein, partial [Candidatus Limivivens sp.]|nr:fibronectin type III domain-containing protein [Candidatus Limivivens sp.]